MADTPRKTLTVLAKDLQPGDIDSEGHRVKSVLVDGEVVKAWTTGSATCADCIAVGHPKELEREWDADVALTISRPERAE